MNHYVYLTCDSSDGRLYWGSRSCDDDPKDDSYMGSHKDTTYNPDLKWVWATFETRLEADDAEDILHDLFDVVESETFANLSKRTFRHWEWVGSRHTPETCEKLSEMKLGEKNPAFGKTTSDKQKEAVRKASTGRKDSKETTRRKQRAQKEARAERAHKRLFHNPKTNQQKFFDPGHIPDGWIKGESPSVKAQRRDTRSQIHKARKCFD
jgi:hypothetical protein